MSNTNGNQSTSVVRSSQNSGPHGARELVWSLFIRYCAELGHGEIDKLKIQDGVPVMAELTTKKVRFGP